MLAKPFVTHTHLRLTASVNQRAPRTFQTNPMYYPRNQVIFIAINKCGSSSVLQALNDALYDPDVPEIWQLQGKNKVRRVHENLKHAQAYFYQQSLGKEAYDKCLTISQVRNP